MNRLTLTIIIFAAYVPAVVLHEVSHGWMALRFGDTTARDAGRLTLNPLKHIDPFGTILLPALLAIAGWPSVGYAKPVPVNINRLRKPRNQSVYVAIIGPITNIVLSAIAWLLLRRIGANNPNVNVYIRYFIAYFGITNMLLAVINLLPIPPLDGSAIVERLVPRKHLGSYFALRARALPFAMIAMMAFLYFLSPRIFNPLVHWWISGTA
jgi:Zn-dependent protease